MSGGKGAAVRQKERVHSDWHYFKHDVTAVFVSSAPFTNRQLEFFKIQAAAHGGIYVMVTSSVAYNRQAVKATLERNPDVAKRLGLPEPFTDDTIEKVVTWALDPPADKVNDEEFGCLMQILRFNPNRGLLSLRCKSKQPFQFTDAMQSAWFKLAKSVQAHRRLLRHRMQLKKAIASKMEPSPALPKMAVWKMPEPSPFPIAQQQQQEPRAVIEVVPDTKRSARFGEDVKGRPMITVDVGDMEDAPRVTPSKQASTDSILAYLKSADQKVIADRYLTMADDRSAIVDDDNTKQFSSARVLPHTKLLKERTSRDVNMAAAMTATDVSRDKPDTKHSIGMQQRMPVYPTPAKSKPTFAAPKGQLEPIVEIKSGREVTVHKFRVKKTVATAHPKNDPSQQTYLPQPRYEVKQDMYYDPTWRWPWDLYIDAEESQLNDVYNLVVRSLYRFRVAAIVTVKPGKPHNHRTGEMAIMHVAYMPTIRITLHEAFTRAGAKPDDRQHLAAFLFIVTQGMKAMKAPVTSSSALTFGEMPPGGGIVELNEWIRYKNNRYEVVEDDDATYKTLPIMSLYTGDGKTIPYAASPASSAAPNPGEYSPSLIRRSDWNKLSPAEKIAPKPLHNPFLKLDISAMPPNTGPKRDSSTRPSYIDFLNDDDNDTKAPAAVVTTATSTAPSIGNTPTMVLSTAFLGDNAVVNYPSLPNPERKRQRERQRRRIATLAKEQENQGPSGGRPALSRLPTMELVQQENPGPRAALSALSRLPTMQLTYENQKEGEVPVGAPVGQPPLPLVEPLPSISNTNAMLVPGFSNLPPFVPIPSLMPVMEEDRPIDATERKTQTRAKLEQDVEIGGVRPPHVPSSQCMEDSVVFQLHSVNLAASVGSLHDCFDCLIAMDLDLYRPVTTLWIPRFSGTSPNTKTYPSRIVASTALKSAYVVTQIQHGTQDNEAPTRYIAIYDTSSHPESTTTVLTTDRPGIVLPSMMNDRLQWDAWRHKRTQRPLPLSAYDGFDPVERINADLCVSADGDYVLLDGKMPCVANVQHRPLGTPPYVTALPEITSLCRIPGSDCICRFESGTNNILVFPDVVAYAADDVRLGDTYYKLLKRENYRISGPFLNPFATATGDGIFVKSTLWTADGVRVVSWYNSSNNNGSGTDADRTVAFMAGNRNEGNMDPRVVFLPEMNIEAARSQLDPIVFWRLHSYANALLALDLTPKPGMRMECMKLYARPSVDGKQMDIEGMLMMAPSGRHFSISFSVSNPNSNPRNGHRIPSLDNTVPRFVSSLIHMFSSRTNNTPIDAIEEIMASYLGAPADHYVLQPETVTHVLQPAIKHIPCPAQSLTFDCRYYDRAQFDQITTMDGRFLSVDKGDLRTREVVAIRGDVMWLRHDDALHPWSIPTGLFCPDTEELNYQLDLPRGFTLAMGANDERFWGTPQEAFSSSGQLVLLNYVDPETKKSGISVADVHTGSIMPLPNSDKVFVRWMADEDAVIVIPIGAPCADVFYIYRRSGEDSFTSVDGPFYNYVIGRDMGDGFVSQGLGLGVMHVADVSRPGGICVAYFKHGMMRVLSRRKYKVGEAPLDVKTRMFPYVRCATVPIDEKVRSKSIPFVAGRVPDLSALPSDLITDEDLIELAQFGRVMQFYPPMLDWNSGVILACHTEVDNYEYGKQSVLTDAEIARNARRSCSHTVFPLRYAFTSTGVKRSHSQMTNDEKDVKHNDNATASASGSGTTSGSGGAAAVSGDSNETALVAVIKKTTPYAASPVDEARHKLIAETAGVVAEHGNMGGASVYGMFQDWIRAIPRGLSLIRSNTYLNRIGNTSMTKLFTVRLLGGRYLGVAPGDQHSGKLKEMSFVAWDTITVPLDPLKTMMIDVETLPMDRTLMIQHQLLDDSVACFAAGIVWVRHNTAFIGISLYDNGKTLWGPIPCRVPEGVPATISLFSLMERMRFDGDDAHTMLITVSDIRIDDTHWFATVDLTTNVMTWHKTDSGLKSLGFVGSSSLYARTFITKLADSTNPNEMKKEEAIVFYNSEHKTARQIPVVLPDASKYIECVFGDDFAVVFSPLTDEFEIWNYNDPAKFAFPQSYKYVFAQWAVSWSLGRVVSIDGLVKMNVMQFSDFVTGPKRSHAQMMTSKDDEKDVKHNDASTSNATASASGSGSGGAPAIEGNSTSSSSSSSSSLPTTAVAIASNKKSIPTQPNPLAEARHKFIAETASVIAEHGHIGGTAIYNMFHGWIRAIPKRLIRIGHPVVLQPTPNMDTISSYYMADIGDRYVTVTVEPTYAPTLKEARFVEWDTIKPASMSETPYLLYEEIKVTTVDLDPSVIEKHQLAKLPVICVASDIVWMRKGTSIIGLSLYDNGKTVWGPIPFQVPANTPEVHTDTQIVYLDTMRLYGNADRTMMISAYDFKFHQKMWYAVIDLTTNLMTWHPTGFPFDNIFATGTLGFVGTSSVYARHERKEPTNSEAKASEWIVFCGPDHKPVRYLPVVFPKQGMFFQCAFGDDFAVTFDETGTNYQIWSYNDASTFVFPQSKVSNDLLRTWCVNWSRGRLIRYAESSTTMVEIFEFSDFVTGPKRTHAQMSALDEKKDQKTSENTATETASASGSGGSGGSAGSPAVESLSSTTALVTTTKPVKPPPRSPTHDEKALHMALADTATAMTQEAGMHSFSMYSAMKDWIRVMPTHTHMRPDSSIALPASYDTRSLPYLFNVDTAKATLVLTKYTLPDTTAGYRLLDEGMYSLRPDGDNSKEPVSVCAIRVLRGYIWILYNNGVVFARAITASQTKPAILGPFQPENADETKNPIRFARRYGHRMHPHEREDHYPYFDVSFDHTRIVIDPKDMSIDGKAAIHPLFVYGMLDPTTNKVSYRPSDNDKFIPPSSTQVTMTSTHHGFVSGTHQHTLSVVLSAGKSRSLRTTLVMFMSDDLKIDRTLEFSGDDFVNRCHMFLNGYAISWVDQLYYTPESEIWQYEPADGPPRLQNSNWIYTNTVDSVGTNDSNGDIVVCVRNHSYTFELTVWTPTLFQTFAKRGSMDTGPKRTHAQMVSASGSGSVKGKAPLSSDKKDFKSKPVPSKSATASASSASASGSKNGSGGGSGGQPAVLDFSRKSTYSGVASASASSKQTVTIPTKITYANAKWPRHQETFRLNSPMSGTLIALDDGVKPMTQGFVSRNKTPWTAPSGQRIVAVSDTAVYTTGMGNAMPIHRTPFRAEGKDVDLVMKVFIPYRPRGRLDISFSTRTDTLFLLHFSDGHVILTTKKRHNDGTRPLAEFFTDFRTDHTQFMCDSDDVVICKTDGTYRIYRASHEWYPEVDTYALAANFPRRAVAFFSGVVAYFGVDMADQKNPFPIARVATHGSTDADPLPWPFKSTVVTNNMMVRYDGSAKRFIVMTYRPQASSNNNDVGVMLAEQEFEMQISASREMKLDPSQFVRVTTLDDTKRYGASLQTMNSAKTTALVTVADLVTGSFDPKPVYDLVSGFVRFTAQPPRAISHMRIESGWHMPSGFDGQTMLVNSASRHRAFLYTLPIRSVPNSARIVGVLQKEIHIYMPMEIVWYGIHGGYVWVLGRSPYEAGNVKRTFHLFRSNASYDTSAWKTYLGDAVLDNLVGDANVVLATDLRQCIIFSRHANGDEDKFFGSRSTEDSEFVWSAFNLPAHWQFLAFIEFSSNIMCFDTKENRLVVAEPQLGSQGIVSVKPIRKTPTLLSYHFVGTPYPAVFFDEFAIVPAFGTLVVMDYDLGDSKLVLDIDVSVSFDIKTQLFFLYRRRNHAADIVSVYVIDGFQTMSKHRPTTKAARIATDTPASAPTYGTLTNFLDAASS